MDRRIRRRFPFRLTAAQERAIAEIAADMRKAQPMNRLLQGDVGSGKTVVAAYAMLAAIAQKTYAGGRVDTFTSWFVAGNELPYWLQTSHFLRN